jgi:hypothetical protein
MRWFGPGTEEIWGQLCDETDCELVRNGRWNGFKVRLHVKPWTIVLDKHTVSDGESSTTYTRMRVPFLNPAGFRFQITRKGPLSGLAKMLGMQDIEVGDAEFDEAFIIKSNDEATVRELLANPGIRQKIQALPGVRLEIKDNEGWFGTTFPDDADELLFLAPGVIKDVALLKALFELFATMLEQLCRIRATTRQDPGVSL